MPGNDHTISKGFHHIASFIGVRYQNCEEEDITHDTYVFQKGQFVTARVPEHSLTCPERLLKKFNTPHEHRLP